MRSTWETWILSLCFALSLCLFILSLACGARVAACNEEAAALKLACESMQQENRRLEVRAACSENLSEVESFAREKMDMEPLSAEQIIHIEG